MAALDNLVAQLAAQSGAYTPNKTVLKGLHHVNLVPLIGPAAIGKTAVIAAVQKLEPGFQYATSFTTRPPRAGEVNPQFLYLPHSVATLQRLLAEKEAGELVQYIVHPTTGYVYGSHLSDYAGSYNFLPALSSSVQQLRQLPFSLLHEVTITASATDWAERFNKHSAHFAAHETQKRLHEALASIEWSLDQPAMLWLTNDAGQLDKSATRLLQIVQSGTNSSAKGFNTAKLLHSYIKKLLV